MDRTTISGNTTSGSGDGGGIYVDGSGATITNVTISGNTAATGGGLFNDGSGVTIVATTIASNTGGGIDNNGSGVSLEGTIVANNGVNCAITGSPITDGGTNLQFPGTTCGAQHNVRRSTPSAAGQQRRPDADSGALGREPGHRHEHRGLSAACDRSTWRNTSPGPRVRHRRVRAGIRGDLRHGVFRPELL